jgi:hypothetical protein
MRADKDECEKEDSRSVRNSASLEYELDGGEIAAMFLVGTAALGVISFDRRVNRSAANNSEIKSLAKGVLYFGKF